MTAKGPEAQPAVELAAGFDDCRHLDIILNSLNALIYVADMETHELLFLNEYGRAYWGEPNGRPCWQVLQSGQDGPCAFCTNPQLVDALGQPTGPLVWEFQNPITGRWYQCRDQAVRWVDGRLVRLEIATDITDRKRLEQDLEAAVRRAEVLARTDELTGLNNRRAFFDLGTQAFKQSRRFGRPIALIMFDVDHFKRINDTHGHTTGDQVLQALVTAARPLIRDTDILGRLGGEEFALILPETDLPQALAVAQRLQAAIAGVTVAHGSAMVRCTCSFGVAASSSGCTTLDQLLTEADSALLQAKAAGRNRIDYVQVKKGI